MRLDDDFPAAWGRTLVGTLHQDPDDGEWEFSDWFELAYPSEKDGRYGHHSGGSIAPDTVAIAVDGDIIAVADSGHIAPFNLYVYDQEYFQFLRLREVIDPDRWAEQPWGQFRPGQLLHAWDKFHGRVYFRLPGRPPLDWGFDDPGWPGLPPAMSYGGDWYDLAQQVEDEYPTDLAGEPVTASPPRLFRAVEDNDVATVIEQLAAGADPNIGVEAPFGVHESFCEPRGRTPLGMSIAECSPEMTAALLAGGARVDGGSRHAWSPLQYAIKLGKADHIAVLIRYGAAASSDTRTATLPTDRQ
ncbi:ankyrin repeat domain-containing protein [Nocardia sp. NPDC058705]|uniref:ankyrin repeat domain-containing protein n=1 Tax=Nocardia sp. NPDC058705 TaxID=3346609 RepID=UPI00367FA2D1